MNPTTPPSMTKPRLPAPGCHPAQLEPCNILQWGQTDWKSWGHSLYNVYIVSIFILFLSMRTPQSLSKSLDLLFSLLLALLSSILVLKTLVCWWAGFVLENPPIQWWIGNPVSLSPYGQSSATMTIFDHPNPGDIQSHRNQHWLKSAPAILVGLRFGHALILQLRHVLLHYGRWQLFHHVAISKSACGPCAGFSSMG